MNNAIYNLKIFLPRLLRAAEEDGYFAEMLVEELEPFLDSLASDDFFGTERQSDPRGDFRIKEWSLFGEVQE